MRTPHRSLLLRSKLTRRWESRVCTDEESAIVLGMKTKDIVAKIYAVYLFLVALAAVYYFSIPIFFHKGFWDSNTDELYNALITSGIFILFLAYLLYMGIHLFVGKYPRFLAAWIALPYVLLLLAFSLLGYVFMTAT